MPTPNGNPANQDEVILRLRIEADQAKKELESIRNASRNAGQSIVSSIAAQGAGMMPNIFMQAGSNLLGSIGSVGSSQLGAMAQRGADAFFGRGSIASGFIKDMREMTGTWEANASTQDRLTAMMTQFARMGIPMNGDFARGAEGVIHAQEKAAQAADTLSKNVAFDARATRHENDYDDTVRAAKNSSWGNILKKYVDGFQTGLGLIFR